MRLSVGNELRKFCGRHRGELLQCTSSSHPAKDCIKNIIISITDEGPGLPEGTEQSIFKRFYQERPKDEKFGTHSGLGLSISEQVIKVHGGVIKAENVRNSFEQTTGACFSILMPKKIG